MNIVVHEDDTGLAPRSCRFTAIDADTHDGAADAGVLSRCYGCGASPEEAIADYWRLYAELVGWLEAET